MDKNWRKKYHGNFGPSGRYGAGHRHRFLIGRFIGGALFFAILLALFGGGLALLFVSIARLAQLSPAVTWLLGCTLPLLALILMGAGWRAFRSVGRPLANIMVAADALAEGDLSVRVPGYGPGEFGRLARAFNRMAAKLEMAEQQRRNLTADVAHELRTPLHILQGNLEGLQDGVYEPTQEQFEAMLEETYLLTRLVDDLQTLSLAEAGQLPLHLAQVRIDELLADVATSFSGQAEAANIRLIVENQLAPEYSIEADADRLDQVLSNLIDNGLRHTQGGGTILIRASLIQEGVRLIVKDSGEGILADDLPFIFDRFWRGDRSRTRTGRAGSGLGLAIARQLVRAHAGTIEVESQPGTGTTFTIDLTRPGSPNGEGQQQTSFV
jgi:signal transduction histidine kinase